MNISEFFCIIESNMEFELILFLKVVVVLACHAAFLYFIFRNLDKVFASKNSMLPEDNVSAIYGEDLYRLEVRSVGGDIWSDAASPGPYTASGAAYLVANLNAVVTGSVYRAVLIAARNKCDK